MHPIIQKAVLSPNVTQLRVSAPRIAEIRQAGQFVIVRRAPGAERIPLTIADADPAAGTITLVIQAIGKSTQDLVDLDVGDAIQDVAGPLGRPTELIETGHAVCVGGGVGTAVVHPIAQGLAHQGVRVTSVIGGRSREWVIFEDELRGAGEVITCTDDGSYGRPGPGSCRSSTRRSSGGVDGSAATVAAGGRAAMIFVRATTRASVRVRSRASPIDQINGTTRRTAATGTASRMRPARTPRTGTRGST